MKRYLFLLLCVGHSMKPILIGHRGACGHAPENTLKSFEKAISCGVDMIEFDVHVCKSGELVVLHDDTVDRTTNGMGAVKDFTLAQLKEFDAGEGEKIPTLRELFDQINHRVKLYIELKGPDTALPVLALIEEYVKERGWAYEDFLVASFDHYQLHSVKEKAPYIKIAPITDTIFLGYGAYLKRLQADVVVLGVESVRGQFFEEIKEMGLPIFVFTPNNTEEISWALEEQVAGIITDYPDRVYTILNKKPGL